MSLILNLILLIITLILPSRTVTVDKVVDEMKDGFNNLWNNATKDTITRKSGQPVVSNKLSLQAGYNGPLLLQDIDLIEKLAHQNRERIPERVVHAKGWGAYGTFTVTHDISDYTCARIFSQIGKTTDLLVRWSNVAGESGAADAERDLRGFAIKFYTEDGNWDLTGNNTPIFFIRDPIQFPDFIRTQKRHPQTNIRSPQAMFDFWSLTPESIHQITWLFGDRGIPKSPRFMNGYGSHTFSMWNKDGKRYWVKFHYKTMQGIKYLTNEEAEKIMGSTRESFQEDIYNAIKNGDYPKYKLYIQVMTEEEAEKVEYNPFDLTKVWPHGDFPLKEVGIIEINRNAQNYFHEIEQAAFSPSNLIPGIGPSPDKMLQARLFSYDDTHRYRLGIHWESLPPNQPKGVDYKLNNYHKDGFMRWYTNDYDNPNAYYYPNSAGGPIDDKSKRVPPRKITSEPIIDYYDFDYEDEDVDYKQPRALFNLMSNGEKQRLFKNLAAAMGPVSNDVKERFYKICGKVHPDYEKGVRDANNKYDTDVNAVPITKNSPIWV